MTTLDLIEQMCNQEDWPSCKLGGSTSTKKRKQFNDEFNDPTANYFAFLLSSKAGGCGLNLIGGSRLVMFDLDWNPATDKQAAARCWRDGQRYQCYTYRFVSSGTLEERMLQRQLSKEGLQNVIEDKDQVRDAASVSGRFRTSALGRRRRRGRQSVYATPSFDAGQLLRDGRPQKIILVPAAYGF
jgi:DNA repair and recombination RAD54-like protein